MSVLLSNDMLALLNLRKSIPKTTIFLVLAIKNISWKYLGLLILSSN